MAAIHTGRMTVDIEGDFVVFIIGMRVNRWWKVHKWWPVAMAMPRMIKELEANPEAGMLGYEQTFRFFVQYWRSFEHLEAYARSKDNEHWPAWVEYNKRVKASSGDVGIWHETFLVRAGQYEAVYGSMPPVGMGKFGKIVPATGSRDSARGRVAN